MATMLDYCVISENPSHRRSAATPSFEFPLMPCPQAFRSSLVPSRPPLLEHEENKNLGLIYLLRKRDSKTFKMKTDVGIEKAFRLDNESMLR